MSRWYDSWWFNLAKSALLTVVVGLTSAQAAGQLHAPEWLAPVLAAAYGLLQSGQKKGA